MTMSLWKLDMKIMSTQMIETLTKELKICNEFTLKMIELKGKFIGVGYAGFLLRFYKLKKRLGK